MTILLVRVSLHNVNWRASQQLASIGQSLSANQIFSISFYSTLDPILRLDACFFSSAKRPKILGIYHVFFEKFQVHKIEFLLCENFFLFNTALLSLQKKFRNPENKRGALLKKMDRVVLTYFAYL
jgi:hypothetical protein